MTKATKQSIALKSIQGLPEQIEQSFIELHTKLNAFKLSVQPGDEIPQIQVSTAELINRANKNFFDMLTMKQPTEVDSNEKIELRVFYKDYIMPGLAAIKHAFEQSDNLQNYIHSNRGQDIFESLNQITNQFEKLYETDKNIQYTQICDLANKIKYKIDNLLQAINDNRNR